MVGEGVRVRALPVVAFLGAVSGASGRAAGHTWGRRALCSAARTLRPTAGADEGCLLRLAMSGRMKPVPTNPISERDGHVGEKDMSS